MQQNNLLNIISQLQKHLQIYYFKIKTIQFPSYDTNQSLIEIVGNYDDLIYTSSIIAILALSPLRGNSSRITLQYPPFRSAYLSGACSNNEATKSLS